MQQAFYYRPDVTPQGDPNPDCAIDTVENTIADDGANTEPDDVDREFYLDSEGAE